LRKQHHGLSYHYTREAIASNAVDYQFIPGHLNPADILSKHWGYQQVWASTLRPILFWRGDTSGLLLDESQPTKRTKAEVKDEVTSGMGDAKEKEKGVAGKISQPKGSDKSLA